eukprot:COSAG01_NODE_1210_length_11227_cov_46.803019_3_plen_45_part_00
MRASGMAAWDGGEACDTQLALRGGGLDSIAVAGGDGQPREGAWV